MTFCFLNTHIVYKYMCIWRCQYHGNQEQVNKQHFSFALDQLLPPGWPCLIEFLSWLLQWWTAVWMWGSNKPCPPQFDFGHGVSSQQEWPFLGQCVYIYKSFKWGYATRGDKVSTKSQRLSNKKPCARHGNFSLSCWTRDSKTPQPA